MVIRREDQIHLEFGNGDISISSGTNGEQGIVIFENQEPREIGSPGIQVPREVIVEGDDDIPVYMTFSRPESIDVLISELQNAKIAMLAAK